MATRKYVKFSGTWLNDPSLRVLQISFQIPFQLWLITHNIHRQIPQDLHTQSKPFPPWIPRRITWMESAHCIHSTSKWTKRRLIYLHLLEFLPVIKQDLNPTPIFLTPTWRLHPKLTIQKWKPCKCWQGWIIMRMNFIGPRVCANNGEMKTFRNSDPMLPLVPRQLQK